MRMPSRFYDMVERKELAPTTMDMKTDSIIGKNVLTETVDKGSVVNAIYSYTVQLYVSRVEYTEEEVLSVDTTIKGLFVIFGEQCLDSYFLTSELQKALPKIRVANAEIIEADKYYTTTKRRGRMETMTLRSSVVDLLQPNTINEEI